MATRRSLVVVGVVIVVTAGVILAWHWLDTARRPRIEIVNQTGTEIRDLRCTLDAGGTSWTRVIRRLPNGASFRETGPGADLVVQALHGRVAGLQFQNGDGYNVTAFETLTLAIGPKGKVSHSMTLRW